MSLHASSIHFRGSHSGEMPALFERLGYRVVGQAVDVTRAAEAARLLDTPTGSRNVVRKLVYEAHGWTYLSDPEMVVMFEDEALTEYARSHASQVFAWVCEGVSGSYGFRLFEPCLVRDVFYVGGELVMDSGTPIAQELGTDWPACSEDQMLAVAERLGAPFDLPDEDRPYTVYTLDESAMAPPEVDDREAAGRATPSRPWWRFW